jgi:replication-associated recombination protein RarA
MKRHHKHFSVSSETKVMSFMFSKENGDRRRFIKMMEEAEHTAQKKKAENLKKIKDFGED